VAWLTALGTGCGGQVDSAARAGPIDAGHADVTTLTPADAADGGVIKPSFDAPPDDAADAAAAAVSATSDAEPAKDAASEDAAPATCGCAAGNWHIDLELLGADGGISEVHSLVEAYPLDIHCLEDAPLVVDNCFGALRLSGCGGGAEPCLYLAQNASGFLLGHLFTGGVYLPMVEGILTAGPITNGGRSGTFSGRVLDDGGAIELRGSFVVCAPPLPECAP
jgi:hypothetical protein